MVTLFWSALFVLVGAFASFPAQASFWQPLKAITAVRNHNDGVELQAGNHKIEIKPMSEGIIRVRVGDSKTPFEKSSWAVTLKAQASTKKISFRERGSALELQVQSGFVLIDKKTTQITFLDSNRKIILADASPMSFDGERFRLTKAIPEDEHYYGLGDKVGSMDHRGQSFQNWNSDQMGWQESTDPLYKTIPFFLTMRKGQSYGVFLDNTWRSFFDFGKTEKDRLVFGADGGPIDYYFIYGPQPKTVLQRYSTLVGTVPLPPLWALGYQQCRWSYPTEKKVRDVAALLRQNRIPTDAIYLDIDYQNGNAPFTVDETKFPHFAKMVSDLRDQGLRTIAITDLHLKKSEGYRPYEEGLAKDFFVKNPDGSPYVGVVWPGPSTFPDFTRTKVREWWGTLYTDFVGQGVAGFWNDMNEPAIFNVPSKTMPLDVRHGLDDGRKATHAEIHNVYGMQNARATYEGLLKLQPNVRPFVLTRAAYAGTQRYAATWTGDNTSSWNHLRMMTPQLLSLGLSGYTFAGADIGGFVGTPSPDLLTRWHEVGAFTPMYRNHTMAGTADQEPWEHGEEHLKIRRHYIELRYQLLPYIYTAMEEASRTGVPLMRPLFLEYPETEKFYKEAVFGMVPHYLFGADLLIVPKVVELLDPAPVPMPPGVWYNFWTGEKVQGNKDLWLNPDLATLPIFVRAGSIVPMQPLVQSTSEIPSGPLELHVFPGARCEGSAYFDDGTSLNYKRGDFASLNVTCEDWSGTGAVKKLSIKWAKLEGGFKPWWSQVKVVIHGEEKVPEKINLPEGRALGATFDNTNKTVSIESIDGAQGAEIILEKTE